MPVEIWALTPADVDPVVTFSLRAWVRSSSPSRPSSAAPSTGTSYPGRLVSPARAVEGVCRDEAISVWVAIADGRAVGFVAAVFHDESHSEPDSGEIKMLAVDRSANAGGSQRADLLRRRLDARGGRPAGGQRHRW